jgi:hypothetical protein
MQTPPISVNKEMPTFPNYMGTDSESEEGYLEKSNPSDKRETAYEETYSCVEPIGLFIGMLFLFVGLALCIIGGIEMGDSRRITKLNLGDWMITPCEVFLVSLSGDGTYGSCVVSVKGCFE